MSPRRHADDDAHGSGLADALARWDTAQTWMRAQQDAADRPDRQGRSPAGGNPQEPDGPIGSAGPTVEPVPPAAVIGRTPFGAPDPPFPGQPAPADRAAPPGVPGGAPVAPPADATSTPMIDSNGAVHPSGWEPPDPNQRQPAWMFHNPAPERWRWRPGLEGPGADRFPGVAEPRPDGGWQPAPRDEAQLPPPPPVPESWDALLSAERLHSAKETHPMSISATGGEADQPRDPQPTALGGEQVSPDAALPETDIPERADGQNPGQPAGGFGPVSGMPGLPWESGGHAPEQPTAVPVQPGVPQPQPAEEPTQLMQPPPTQAPPWESPAWGGGGQQHAVAGAGGVTAGAGPADQSPLGPGTSPQPVQQAHPPAQQQVQGPVTGEEPAQYRYSPGWPGPQQSQPLSGTAQPQYPAPPYDPAQSPQPPGVWSTQPPTSTTWPKYEPRWSPAPPPVVDAPVWAPPGERGAPTVEDLTAQSLIRQRKRPPRTGWRKALYTLSAHAVNPGEAPADVRQRELMERATVPVRGCYRIAVISLKGGVGKTTMTVCLGATLASLRGDRVIAVDANPDRGTLSGKIPLETVATVRNLLNDADKIQRYSDVRRYTSQSPDRLEVLASESDPAVSIAFSDQDYRVVAGILERFYNVVLTDCGTGLLHSAMAGVLALANQLVVVSSGSVDGARSASATLDWLEAHGYRALVAGSVAVINSVRPKSGGVDLDKLQEHFAARCRSVVRVPYDPHLEEGAEVDLSELRGDTRDALLELAAYVADGFPRDPNARVPPLNAPSPPQLP